MNSKKLGMIAAAALSVASAQALASGDHAKVKVKDGICANTCGGKHGNGSGCKSQVQAKDAKKQAVTTEAACEKTADAKWIEKTDFKGTLPAAAK